MEERGKIRIRFGKYFIYTDRYNYILSEIKKGVTGDIDSGRDLKAHSFFPTLPMLFDHLLHRRLEESEISSFDGLADSIKSIRSELETPFKAALEVPSGVVSV